MADEGTTTSTAPAPTGQTPNAPISTDPTPAAAPAPIPFDWKTAQLAPEHLNLVTERGWKSPDDVMKSYRNLETATGVPPERLIKLPSAKDAGDPKVWNDIYTKLGRPETADKYVIPLPEGDKGEFATAVKPWMHEAGLSQSQATKLATKWNEHLAATQKQQLAELETSNATEVTALKQAWGTNYEERAGLVDRAAETFGMKQEQLDALKTVLGPKGAMEFLYNIGSKIAVEDRTVPGMSGQSTTMGVMTPEQATARLQEIRRGGDKDYAKLFNSSDPKQRAEARNEVRRLSEIAGAGMSTPVQTTTGVGRPK